MAQVVLYRHPTAMEPLMPSTGQGELAELCREIYLKAGGLSNRLHPTTVRVVAGVVQQMNSYYSNLIEGHATYPRDIEAAMQEGFSDDRETEVKQRLGLAHLKVEQSMEERLKSEPGLRLTSEEFLFWIHRSFYSVLPEGFWIGRDRTGKEYRLEPGTIRRFQVDVGQHQPPDYAHLNRFLDRFDHFYGGELGSGAELIAIAAAHHRLLWIHPFGDGNGRVARLFSGALLQKARVGAYGLWTLSRGLARYRADYYRYLELADQQRESDSDGRGNLSDRGLFEFVRFFLRTIVDQISFMEQLFDLSMLEHRIRDHIFRENVFGRQGEPAFYLIRESLRQGEVARGEAPRITNRKETAARLILKSVVDKGYLVSDTPRGRVRLQIPSKLHDIYLPRLFLPAAD